MTAGIAQVQEGQAQLAAGMQSVQEEITRLEAQKEQLSQMEEPDAEQLAQIEAALQELRTRLPDWKHKRKRLPRKRRNSTEI